MDTAQNKELKQIYQTLQNLSIVELDALMQQIFTLRKQKMPSILSDSESELLRKINTGLPSALQKRYQALIKKRESESLNATEYSELIELTTYAETHNNQRLKYLIDLAQIRNIPLEQLIDDLQLNPRLNVA